VSEKTKAHYCQPKTLVLTARSIPFGFNIESVAIRKEEIDASLGLLNTVRELLRINGLREEQCNNERSRWFKYNVEVAASLAETCNEIDDSRKNQQNKPRQ
jgi:hypothetical protein